MAEYPPPTENLTEFTPSVFKVSETPLTIEEGKKFFLTYPNAQGTENLATVNIGGDLNITSDASYGTIYGYGTTKPLSGTPLHNTAVGYQAGRTLDTLSTSTSSGGNSGFGGLSLYSVTGAASNNTGLGHNALREVSTGSSNTQVGFTTQALSAHLTTASQNTLIGASASVSGTAISGATALGYLAEATVSSSITLGRSGIDSVRLNYITPMYTSLPNFVAGDVGYEIPFGSNSFITPATGSVFSTSPVIPIGVWGFKTQMLLRGTVYSTGIVQLTSTASGGTKYYFPITQTSVDTIGFAPYVIAIISGYAVVNVSTASTFTLTYYGTPTSTLTVDINTSHIFTAKRIA